jgi:carbamoylphosphate synthase small subunit
MFPVRMRINKMRITKSKLRQIIKEELEVVLTDQEVVDFFGVDTRSNLDEGGFFQDATAEEGAEAAEEEGEAESAAALAGGDKADYAASAATPTLESKEADMISKLEMAIENAKEMVASLSDDDRGFREEAEKVLNHLETRYDHIMKGRIE